MQGKSFVRFFTIALVLVVTYIFILMIPTTMIERASKEYATSKTVDISDLEMKALQEDIEQQYFLDSVSDETVLNIGIKSYTYQELKRHQLAYGLDLQGGMSVVLQVNLTELLVTLSNKSSDPDFLKALENAKKNIATAQTDFVTLFGREYSAISQKPLARLFIASNKVQGIDINSTNEQVLVAIRAEASATVESTYNLLKKRIDKFGVASPTVFLDKNTDRITVELPGVRSPKRARELLQATASLEFWELFTAVEILGGQTEGPLVKLNNVLKRNPEFNGGADNVAEQDSLKAARIDEVKSDTTLEQAAIDSLVAAVEEEFASKVIEPIFSRMSMAQPNDDKAPFIVSVKAADTAIVMKMLHSEEAQRFVPARDYRFAWHAESQKGDEGIRYYSLYVLKTRGKQEAELNGTHITYSYPTSNQSGMGYAVSLSMNSEGARLWKKMTGENVGKCVAVVLDNKVQSAPVVQGEISGGGTSISGNFSATAATDLANMLSIGKLPASPEIIEEAIVGPSLGAATVSAGLWALVIGLVLVLIFMLIYYAGAGVLAVISLVLNIFFIFGCLASFGSVLTLPGIAGIVLTIGMAVDANVIIFERIREELRAGAVWKEAIVKGFNNSYSAIIDANVTTFVVALILFQYGLGPIKGFATVLMIGVICSVFAAVLFSRLLFDGRIVKNKPVSVWIEATKNVLAAPKINFIGLRKYAYILSSVLILAGVVSMFTNGFELGVDFRGGRSYTVEFAQSVNTTDLKDKLNTAFGGDGTLVKSFNSSNQVKVTTSFMQDATEDGADSTVLAKLLEGCNAYASTNTDYATFLAGKPENAPAGLYLNASSKVGPAIANDIKESAFWATSLSLLFIFIYILLRFRRWQFSLGAIAALFHDVLIVLGLFSLLRGFTTFSLEIDQAFIAAILTIIGYSINDTVIVYDRIREEATLNPEGNIKDIVNTALNNTLSRTAITSLTTFLVVLILFFFGGAGIAGFAFALFMGLIVGTYSSIFIASPIVVDTTKDVSKFKYEELEDEFKNTEEDNDDNSGLLVEDNNDETKG